MSVDSLAGSAVPSHMFLKATSRTPMLKDDPHTGQGAQP